MRKESVIRQGWSYGAVALLSFLLAGCAGPEEPEVAIPPHVGDGEQLEITGNDRMQFNLNAFTTDAGAEITIVFRHVGRQPKDRMGHNLVFLRKGVDQLDFGRAASPHADNEYLPPDRMDEVLAATRVLGPGESETLTLTVPEEPGDYGFVCTFVGHARDMRGVMIVRAGED